MLKFSIVQTTLKYVSLFLLIKSWHSVGELMIKHSKYSV